MKRIVVPVCKPAWAAGLLALTSIVALAVDIDPLTTRWTFGAHEPYTMYRRVGKHCTGGIDGNAQWVQEWLNWFDEKSPEVMARKIDAAAEAGIGFFIFDGYYYDDGPFHNREWCIEETKGLMEQLENIKEL